ncbi:hypothetical protein PybrP1_002532 [[Pythium] brassicae (nom. inval.)]|nr:hypothetical protein PybrP1_002532 [[Pythium] brassicae (nom. inval.)]
MATRVQPPRRHRRMEQWASQNHNVWEAVRFRQSPATSRLVQVWQEGKPWRVSRAVYKASVAGGRASRDEAARNKMRVPAASEATDDVMQWALDRVGGMEVGTMAGLHAYERQTNYLLKTGTLRMWNRKDASPSCAHESRAGVRNSRAHMLWDCPAAERIWEQLGAKSEALGLKAAFQSRRSPFQFKLPQTLLRGWQHLRQRD